MGKYFGKKNTAPLFIEEAYDIQKVEGGYVVVGVTNEDHVLFGRSHGWIIKVDEKGDLLWEKKYTAISYSGIHWADTFREVRELNDGSLVVIGNSENFNTALTTMGILVKLTAEGDSLWTKAYHSNFSNHIFWDFEQAQDDGFTICGHANYGVESGTRDGWVLKVDSLGNTCQPANCDSVFTTSIQYDVTTHYPTSFYPNPAKDQLSIQWIEQPLEDKLTLTIINGMGQEVKNYKLTAEYQRTNIAIEGLESGVYYIQIQGVETIYSFEKVVLIK